MKNMGAMTPQRCETGTNKASTGCASLRRRSSYNSDAIFAYDPPLESSIQELQFKKKFDPSTTIYVPQISHFVKPLHFHQKTRIFTI